MLPARQWQLVALVGALAAGVMVFTQGSDSPGLLTPTPLAPVTAPKSAAVTPVQAKTATPAQPMRATVDQPAVITIPPAPEGVSTPQAVAGYPQVVVRVGGYQPAADGPVEAIVRVRRDGVETEIGRFGISQPNAPRGNEPAKVQSFSIPLPKELAGGPLEIAVQLKSATGGGKAASMEIVGAEVR